MCKGRHEGYRQAVVKEKREVHEVMERAVLERRRCATAGRARGRRKQESETVKAEARKEGEKERCVCACVVLAFSEKGEKRGSNN